MQELLLGTLEITKYFIICVIIVLGIRHFIKVPDEIFRKLLHFVLLGSLYVWTVSFSTWWIEVLSVIAFVVIVYPILIFFERFKAYSSTVTERKPGELKQSLVIVFLMFAIVVTVTQGIFHDVYLTLASVYAWGIGDAFAALIGKRYGKHKLTAQKSLEGSMAMFLCSFISVAFILSLRGGMTTGVTMIISAITAGVSAVFELYSTDGMDTINCPLASMVTLLLLLRIFGGL